MSTEIKDWLDLDDAGVRAKLAKELIALANHGGGFLLFGFSETQSGWAASSTCPYRAVRYSQDGINDILKRHAEPTFECYVHHLQSSLGNDHVVVEVPGGHVSPIRANRSPQGSGLTDHTYYIRRPGPESAAPQSGREWEALIRRCLDNDHQRQVESFRRIIGALISEPTLAQRVADVASGSAKTLHDWTEASLDRLRRLDDDGS